MRGFERGDRTGYGGWIPPRSLGPPRNWDRGTRVAAGEEVAVIERGGAPKGLSPPGVEVRPVRARRSTLTWTEPTATASEGAPTVAQSRRQVFDSCADSPAQVAHEKVSSKAEVGVAVNRTHEGGRRGTGRKQAEVTRERTGSGAYDRGALREEETESSRGAGSPFQTGTRGISVEEGKLPKLRVLVGRVVAEALVDTGSVKSFIRLKLSVEAGLEVEELTEEQSFVCASGRSLCTPQRTRRDKRCRTSGAPGGFPRPVLTYRSCGVAAVWRTERSSQKCEKLKSGRRPTLNLIIKQVV